jgi:transcriptional regulator with XRE-family HTH domain
MARKPDPVDIRVGKNIRIFRLAKGLSQSALGERLGVTFQQVQKYENGVNRVGSSRIAKISKILGVPIGRFFDGSGKTADGVTDELVTDLLSKPYAIRILRALAEIPDDRTRLSLVKLTESIGQQKG